MTRMSPNLFLTEGRKGHPVIQSRVPVPSVSSASSCEKQSMEIRGIRG
jgi:hypothetical protein